MHGNTKECPQIMFQVEVNSLTLRLAYLSFVPPSGLVATWAGGVLPIEQVVTLRTNVTEFFIFYY
jgi:hypothetical protein